MESKHTPGKLRKCGGMTPRFTALVSERNEYIVFRMADGTVDTEAGGPINAPDMDTQASNARRIALCWNSHDQLLEACKAAIHDFDTNNDSSMGGDAYDKLIAAITAATEEGQ